VHCSGGAADGRAQGFTRAQITFLIGNDAAEQAYAGAGFTFDDERRHPDFEAAVGAPGLRRLVRDL
jgi:translation initiation factor 4G